ncbi:MAG: phosphotransferase family protein [Actinomycetota bacterium]|nr:MAG: phosphotransferase family protein [Actinomycetota bacterium]
MDSGDLGYLRPAALAHWLDAHGAPGAGEPLSIERLSGGTQNDLFALQRGEHRMVLRRPPRVVPSGRAQGMRREHRLLQALRGTDVPHARLIAGDDSDDLMGTPFYVMEWVEGWSPTKQWETPFDVDLEARRELAFELIESAGQLARVDWRANGLEGFGRPEGFHERQVDRWLAYLDEYRVRDLDGIDVASDFLRRHRPDTFTPGIMHGDYQLFNVMFRHGLPASLAAIIDFEMTTIGDPLVDLGWAVLDWGPGCEDIRRVEVDLAGMPEPAEALARYTAVSGLTTDRLDYYVVLARWKLAIVLEKSYARWQAGEAVDPAVYRFEELIPNLMRQAAELASTSDLEERHL